MEELVNPVARSVLVRVAGPLVPIWMFGVAFVLLLDTAGPGLPTPALGVLFALYSVLVGALASALYRREWRRSPATLALAPTGLTARGPDPRGPALDVPFAVVTDVTPPGYFPARVVARPDGGAVAWLNVTGANARRIRAAWRAWSDAAGVAGRPATQPAPAAPTFK